MKFYCNRCKSAFTTFSKEGGEAKRKEREFAFSHGIENKMRCPKCGASNPPTRLANPKYQKHYRTRYQPKPRYATGEEDYTPPTIILHPDCQKRIISSVGSIGGMKVVCEGCPQVFNCWTGNVDDGLCSEIKAPDADKVKEATKAIVEQDKILLQLQKQRAVFGKVKFGYESRNGCWYCRFGGTVWKLDTSDIEAIKSGNFGTKKTTIIRNSLKNKKLSLAAVTSLLLLEMEVASSGR